MRFSQRIGKKPVKTEIQLESMDQDLRIGLWNLIKVFYIDKMEEEMRYVPSNREEKGTAYIFK